MLRLIPQIEISPQSNNSPLVVVERLFGHTRTGIRHHRIGIDDVDRLTRGGAVVSCGLLGVGGGVKGGTERAIWRGDFLFDGLVYGRAGRMGLGDTSTMTVTARSGTNTVPPTAGHSGVRRVEDHVDVREIDVDA